MDPRIVAVKVQLSEWVLSQLRRTDYMRACAAEDVPVPPNFSTGSSQWTYQGDLSQKLILAGKSAGVYTFATPNARGGCVALPRGPGGTTDQMGIICQSATTGKACFWDNRELGTGDIMRFDNGTTLSISEMQDGSQLAENCTLCHQGNNVFNVAPDDPTWCRLLRGGQAGATCTPMDGPHAAQFTLQVDPGVNVMSVPGTNPMVQHSRYTPLSGSPPRPSWVNNTNVSCGGACHLAPSTMFGPPAMPPSCGADCN